MPDNNNMSAPVELAAGFNPYSDEEQNIKVEEAPTQTAETVVPTTNPIEETVDPIVTLDTQTPALDYNQFVKERFGFDNVEQAEQEFKRVKDFKEPEFEFGDDLSKTLFNAIREGKSDEIFDILNQQKKLDRLISSEVNPSLAVEIIKTNIQNKYKDLNQEEVDLLFYENYNFPAKPEQGYDETDEDYSQKLKGWESQIEFIEKRMVIDAKVIRPEFSKLKSDLKLPDIYKQAEKEAKSQEEFEMEQKARSSYEQALNSDFQSFNGFNVSVKDEEVDIPITFNVADDEKLQMKELLSDFDAESFLGEQWFDANGNPKVSQMMEDLYLLKNRHKIFQKVANEAASQRLLAHLKKTGNVNINQPTPQGTPSQSPTAQMDALAEWAFKA